MRLFIPVMFLVVAGACIPAGAQQSSSGGRTFFDDPAKAIKAEDHPLRLRLVANVAEYRLDLGRRTPQAFRDFVKKTIADAAPKKSGTDGASYNGRGNYEIPPDLTKVLPPAPLVDLALEFRNTGDRPVVFVLHGDPTNCELGLKGPGVITAQLRHGDLRYYGYGRKITLQPGEVHSVPIKKLEVGLDARPPRMRHYWTEPGEIEVSARFSTSIDSKHVPLFVEPVKLTVRDK